MILGLIESGSQGRTQEPFVARDGTFDLPAIAVDAVVETSFHLGAVLGGRSFLAPSWVQRDHSGTYAKFLAAQAMVVFRIVSGIGQEPVKVQVLGGLSYSGRELGRVIARPPSDHGPGKQVRSGMAHEGQLWPTLAPKAPVALALDVVTAGMAGLQTRGINSRLRALLDQPSGSCAVENGPHKRIESPFFRRRL